MVGLTAYLVYGQLAGYLISEDLETIGSNLAAVNRSMAAELATLPSPERANQQDFLEKLDRELEHLDVRFTGLRISLTGPGIRWNLPTGTEGELCDQPPPWVEGSFGGMISAGQGLYFHTLSRIEGWEGGRLCLTAEVDSALLAQAGRDIGQYRLRVLTEERPPGNVAPPIPINGRSYFTDRTIETGQGELPGPDYFFDPVVKFASKFDVVQWRDTAQERTELPVIVHVWTRASLLNDRIFAPLGGIASGYILALIIIGVLFLAVQLVSMVTGLRLTRSITYAVHELYGSTVRLQAGDFTARVRTQREDQLGALCDSFNQMASSIEGLVEESKQKERLENEVEIARHVQEQLFPRREPALRSLTLAGRCLPARGVSGDYYDYGLSEPGKLIFTIGDISGKGVSAALLMASIQSLIRGQVFASQVAGRLDLLGVAELVSRVNRLVCANTSPEKYSTLFVAYYDDDTRELTYTNAGHLPPVLVRNGTTRELTVGGAVVGLFPDIQYDQGSLTLEEGDCLVAYTDGVTEIENSYEEDYGIPRLREFLRRVCATRTPDRLIDSVFEELEEWAPGAEPADDRTLLVVQSR